MAKPPSRLPLVIGILLIALGWGAIYLGWQRSAQLDLETGQLPYLLSGGFGGFGLLLLGAAGVIIDVFLRAKWEAHRTMEEIVAAVERLRAEMAEARAAGAEEEEARVARRPRRMRGR